MATLQIYVNNGQLKEYDVDRITGLQVVNDHGTVLVENEVLLKALKSFEVEKTLADLKKSLGVREVGK